MSMDTLASDLLWEIFLLNANMDDDSYYKINSNTTAAENYERAEIRSRAMVTTTYTSQVCRRWRTLLLTSSSLWGRVVDLELLFLGKENWRVEVLRRTGISLLYVKGRFKQSVKLYVHQNAVIALLDREWPRIQKFHVTLGLSNDHGPLGTHPFWGVIQRPAEHLESFTLTLKVNQMLQPLDDTETPPIRLFLDHAPSLREFSCTDLWIRGPQTVMFSSNIRTIALDHTPGVLTNPPFSFSVPDCLDGLAMTPHLEKLTLYSALKSSSSGSSIKPTRNVNLQFIEEISLFDSPILLTQLLRHITPGDKLHRLKIHSRSYDSEGIRSPRDEAFLGIAELFSRYPRVRSRDPPAAILVNFTYDSLLIRELDVQNLWSSFRRGSGLHIHISGLRDSSYSSVSAIFETFSPWFAHTLTHLQIQTGHDTAGIDGIGSLFSNFLSVRVVCLNVRTPRVIASLIAPEADALPFPQLKKLELISELRLLDVADNKQAIISLLSQRRKAGNPIEVLCFTYMGRNLVEEEESFEWLEIFTGLRVIWATHGKTTREYVCGQWALVPDAQHL
ncbi:hypothetical protein GALMADRAFT_263599 [Galerina marginata CBS 339.88]|uniref:F-box domain-containing protein n=1 Tax=Galerina marginata (strain CBS 339.88) TaxID=685588 RepID=A0A067TTK2_GALM3|nr:hypothetical protein GALMADRAFT_263599 [Galerina marginata CBS 339.88]